MATHARLIISAIIATLRSRERLRLTKRFLLVRRHGSLARTGALSTWALPNELSVTRLGLRIQRGLKGSVQRNRAKRLVREAFRAHKAQLKSGYDLVVVIHQIRDIALAQLETNLVKACGKLGMFA